MYAVPRIILYALYRSEKINPDVRPILISFLSNDRVKTRADLNANIQSKFLKKDKQGMANSY